MQAFEWGSPHGLKKRGPPSKRDSRDTSRNLEGASEKKITRSCNSDTKAAPHQHSSQLEEGEILNSSSWSTSCQSTGIYSGRKSGHYHGPCEDSNKKGNDNKE